MRLWSGSASTVLVFGCLVLTTQAYIPALPTNDSSAVAAGVNESDTSMLSLAWYPKGSYGETVSYQLAGSESSGINEGALVHFSERGITNETTTTPWIALVSCDFNTTGFSMYDDIFTLARDRGAVAALLYSEWSQACVINPEYADPASFDQVMDIFSTKSLISARTIDNEFLTVNQSLYRNFNAERLNDSAAIINETLATGLVPQASYLFATLMASNATMPPSTSNGSDNTTGPITSSKAANNTDLAMIVLYVITGAVSALFCIVILSGAIRAIRHPERYGPRAGDPNIGGTGQSRARGLTRAIVDTFPIVKFSRSPEESPSDGQEKSADPDVEAHGNNMRLEVVTQSRPRTVIAGEGDASSPHSTDEGDEQAASSSHNGLPSPRADATAPRSQAARHSPGDHDVVPAAIGRETCPICIVDFEEGDDLRVLPCEGKHVFHQTCVDPWLLELSSSCPICRQDFNALETMISGGASTDDNHLMTEQPMTEPTAQLPVPRFSRYLRFARGRRGRNWGQQESFVDDPTDPPYPLADNTAIGH